MSRIFITGSTEGLGRAAAFALMDEGHEVLFHARSAKRAESVADISNRSLGVVIGDLASAAETESVAEQVNAHGAMDAVIHNAGIYQLPAREPTPEGHARILAVNTLAPFILTALIKRPARLVYMSSGLHRGGEGSLDDWIGHSAAGIHSRPIVRPSCTSRRWLRIWQRVGRMC